MPGVAPSSLQPYQGTLPDPRCNGDRQRLGQTDTPAVCSSTLFLFKQKHLLLFHKNGYCYILTEGLSNPKQTAHQDTSPTRCPVLIPSVGWQTITSLFNNSHWHTCVWVLTPTLHSPASWVFTFWKKSTLKSLVKPNDIHRDQSTLTWKQVMPSSASSLPTTVYSHYQDTALQNTEGKQKGLKSFFPVSSQKGIFSIFMPFHCKQFLR